MNVKWSCLFRKLGVSADFVTEIIRGVFYCMQVEDISIPFRGSQFQAGAIVINYTKRKQVKQKWEFFSGTFCPAQNSQYYVPMFRFVYQPWASARLTGKRCFS